MRKFRRKHPEQYRHCAMAADAWRMERAGLHHKEIARRLKLPNAWAAQDLVEEGLGLLWVYELEMLPTTLSRRGLAKLAALEKERFPTQRQWNTRVAAMSA